MFICGIKNKVRSYASVAHNAVGDNYDGHDHVKHLDDTYEAFKQYPHIKQSKLILPYFEIKNKRVIQAIYLHNIIENTSISLDELTKEWGETVARAVHHVSKPSGASYSNRKERVKSLNKHLSTLSIEREDELIALVVTVYQRYANLKYSVETNNEKKTKMYFDEYVQFKKAAYRGGLLEPLWSELDNICIMKH